MKISLVIAEGMKQIMLTPESEHEKSCLKMIDAKEEILIAKRWGDFSNEHAKVQVSECQGGYLRLFPEESSLMFILKDKKNKE
jgi:hypothetical protein